MIRGGRFSDGWGSCERREKRFSKPNHDIPSTAETRAKNKACQVKSFFMSFDFAFYMSSSGIIGIQSKPCSSLA